ncbi:unnamed protein product [Timema podura]|uniref:Haloacid dehalogenase-like hydrolase domain-containing 5 n=3 Tax=Timema TaxID=61471 RepID=A0ABN7NJU7_TIMPD|nr:unnamed protein product [Timema podura]
MSSSYETVAGLVAAMEDDVSRYIHMNDEVNKWDKSNSSSIKTNISVLIEKPSFGLMFDIDGVIVRGKKVLPMAKEAFQKLVDSNGKFRVPTVFVTNAGNALCIEKANLLSEWLGLKISEDQVVMAHSPLKMFHQYHDKHVLVSGQGPIVEIAKNLGFKNVITMDQFRNIFPVLDAVDNTHRISVPCTLGDYFPRIEAVVLFGEPVRWETALQLLVDLLMTNGHPNKAPSQDNHPHIPLLACNMDLQWMAEACMPRFGHGAFLLCLEHLYQKITGHNLIYSALIGKPSEITYYHAHRLALSQAKSIDKHDKLKRLYAVGDNICTDVFGANLYNRYLAKHLSSKSKQHHQRIQNLVLAEEPHDSDGVDSCLSILVKTGVYSQNHPMNSLNHSPRDFLPVEEKLCLPNFIVDNVSKAIDLVFEIERFS